MPDRRRFLQSAMTVAALPAVALLSGCESLIDVLGDACPEDPAESGGIDWTPDVLHPVSFGSTDYTVAGGAPLPMRVYYPSHETFSETHRILKLCLDRWPLVLFLHGLSPGRPPCAPGSTNQYYLRWRRIATLLARSGYVVAVPDYVPDPEPGSPQINRMLSVIDWLRTNWEHARWVDKRPEAVAVAGHSFGALLAARLAQRRPGMGAYVGLGGPFTLFDPQGTLLQSLALPSFFMWSANSVLTGNENLDETDHLWNSIPGPKHAAIHQGGHFDYLPSEVTCGEKRGECTSVEPVTSELIALFLARHFPQVRSGSNIPITLVPPTVLLTPKQQFYGGGHFPGLTQMKSDQTCRDINLRWAEGTVSGSRKLGP